MSTATISIYARIGTDPRTHQTSGGKQLTTANVVVNLPCRTADDGAAPMWFNLVCFNERLGLDRMKKGDMISVSGVLQLNKWQKDGEEKEQLQLIADSLHGSRTARPNNGSRQ